MATETFDSENGSSFSGVTIKLPDGTRRQFDSVDVTDVKRLAREAGVRKFHVKNSDGTTLQTRDFPITSGEITVEEYNEAKHGLNYWTV